MFRVSPSATLGVRIRMGAVRASKAWPLYELFDYQYSMCAASWEERAMGRDTVSLNMRSDCHTNQPGSLVLQLSCMFCIPEIQVQDRVSGVIA